MSKFTSHYISCTKLSNNQREFLLVMVFKPSTMTMKNPKLKFSRNPLFKCVKPAQPTHIEVGESWVLIFSFLRLQGKTLYKLCGVRNVCHGSL